MADLTGRRPANGGWRVVGVDTFDGTDWVEGDFETLEAARLHARRRGGDMLKMHVYDAAGRWVSDAGRF